ncbi:MAG TPA: proline dehydrogenase family protein [Vicinamibacterales bacterium]
MDIKRAIVDLAPAPIVRIFAAPYVAGKGVESGVRKADEMWHAHKLHATVDLLGEEVFEREDVEATVALYFRMIDQLNGRSYTSISLKPTQLGIHESEAYCLENIRRVVAYAASHHLQITVDMEDHDFTDVTLRLFKALRSDFDNVGTVLQSRLFRTKDDILALHTKPCKVRICIGIYKEPKAIAYTDKPAMKEKLFEYVQLLLDKGHFPEIATHDEPLIHRCLDYLDRRGCPRDTYEFQMLLGVPRAGIQAQIVNDGRVVRLYVPFAEEWKYAIAYCKRRMAANPMMGAYVMKNLFRKSMSQP